MKIRLGLVSNSSSSSFLIVGLDGGRAFRELLEALCPGINEADDTFDYYGGYGGWKSPSQVLSIYGGDEPQYIGIQALEAFEKGKTINDLKTELIAEAKTLGVNVRPKDIHIHYGEVGNG